MLDFGVLNREDEQCADVPGVAGRYVCWIEKTSSVQMCQVLQDSVLDREDAQCADVPGVAGWCVG